MLQNVNIEPHTWIDIVAKPKLWKTDMRFTRSVWGQIQWGRHWINRGLYFLGIVWEVEKWMPCVVTIHPPMMYLSGFYAIPFTGLYRKCLIKKMTQWYSYLQYNWTSTHTFHISWPMWVKFGKEDLHIMVLSSCEFCEDQNS